MRLGRSIMYNRSIRSVTATIATAFFLLLSITDSQADAARSQSAAIAALANNPNPYRTTGEMFRWLTVVDVRYYGSCGTGESPKNTNLTVLENFLGEIADIDADLSFTLRASSCESDLKPASADSFGIAVIVGGGMPRVRKLLSAGALGDGSELVTAGIREDADSTGCFSSTGKKDGTGRILAGVVYVDPSVMRSESNLCIKATFLSSLGFSGGKMAPYPDSLLSFTDLSGQLSDLDRCLIATLYSPQLELQRPTLVEFNKQLPELVRKSKYCR
jgi:hypothetical protein